MLLPRRVPPRRQPFCFWVFRTFSLALTFGLALPAPSFALRNVAITENQAGLEELEGDLLPTDAGIAERVEPASPGRRQRPISKATALYRSFTDGYFRAGEMRLPGPALVARLSEWFGRDGWTFMYRMGGFLLSEEHALEQYEEAYVRYFRENPLELDALLEVARDIHDPDGEGIHPSAIRGAMSRLRREFWLPETEEFRSHFGDPSQVAFRGDEDVAISGFKGPGARWNPARVPFHDPGLILRPRLRGWWRSGSIEDFWRSNRVILLNERGTSDLLGVAVRSLVRFFSPNKITLGDLSPPFWLIPAAAFPRDEAGMPRRLTPKETEEILKELVAMFEVIWPKLPKTLQANGRTASLDEARAMLEGLTASGPVSEDSRYLSSHVDHMADLLDVLRQRYAEAVPIFLARDALTMLEFEHYVAHLEGKEPVSRAIYQPGSPRESMSDRPRSAILDPVLWTTGLVMDDVQRDLSESLELPTEEIRELLLQGKVRDPDMHELVAARFGQRIAALLNGDSDPRFSSYTRQLYDNQVGILGIPPGTPLVIVDGNATGRTGMYVKTVIELLSVAEGRPRKADVFLGWARDKVFGMPELSHFVDVKREPFHDLHWPFVYERTKSASGRPVFSVRTSLAKLLLLTYQSVRLYNAAVDYVQREAPKESAPSEVLVASAQPETAGLEENGAPKPEEFKASFLVLGLTKSQFVLEYYRNGYFRPGQMGWERRRVLARLNAWFGDGGWEIRHRIGDRFISEPEAYALYEQAYHEYFRQHPQELRELLALASDIYDTHPGNVASGTDYSAQTPNQAAHLQDIAIRRVVERFRRDYSQPEMSEVRGVFADSSEIRFHGDHLVQIRGKGTEGYRFSPGVIPFHRPDLILQPALPGWWAPGAVEDFFQSNKVIVLTPKGKRGWLLWAIRNSARFFFQDRLPLQDVHPPFWHLEPENFPVDPRTGEPREFTAAETGLVLRELVDFYERSYERLPVSVRVPGAVADARAMYSELMNPDVVTGEQEYMDSHVQWMPDLFRLLEEQYPGAVPIFLARDTLTMHEYAGYRAALLGQERPAYTLYQPGSRNAPLGVRQPHRAFGHALRQVDRVMEATRREMKARPRTPGEFREFQDRFTRKVASLLRADRRFAAYSRQLYEEQFMRFPIPAQRPLVVVDANAMGKRSMYVRAILDLFSQEAGLPRPVHLFVGWARDKSLGLPELASHMPVDSEPFRSLDWPFVYEREGAGSDQPVVSVRATLAKTLLLTYQSMKLYNAAVAASRQEGARQKSLQEALAQFAQEGNPLTLRGPQYLTSDGVPSGVPDALRVRLSSAASQGRMLLLFDEAQQAPSGLRIFHRQVVPADARVPEGVTFYPIPPTREELAQAVAGGRLPAVTDADHLWLDAETIPEEEAAQWAPGARPATLRITSSALNKVLAEGPGAIGALIRAAEWARRNGVTLTVEDAAVEALRGYRVVVLTAA